MLTNHCGLSHHRLSRMFTKHHVLYSLLFCVLLPLIHGQSNWTGNMHPSIGFPANCDITNTNACAPSYSTLQSAGALWQCPTGNATAATCGANGCVPGSGDNPLCNNLDASSPCCCPAPGCHTTPNFNWIVGVCKGFGCACGKSTSRSCTPQNQTNHCGSSCTGPEVPCCFGNDVSSLQPYYNEGTHAVINYIAAYQFDAVNNNWKLQPESSFNTDGRYPAFDMMKPYGGLSKENAWLAPQPGGAVYWSLGYYPAGVVGVGPPGAMFVMSTEDWFAGTWYTLNQLTLDRGPGASYPKAGCAGGINDNCWAGGNAGEMDFLEPAWNDPNAAEAGYRHSYSTQNNQIGRCFVGGINGGGFASQNYLLTEQDPRTVAPEPTIYVAVMDSVGTFVYRIPAANSSTIWPGIGRKAANATVQAAPSVRVDSINPGTTAYAATFTSNCQAKNYTAARAQDCGFNGQQGFCGNWWSKMGNTQQPLFPNASCVRDIRGGEEMPWCACMVGKGSC